MSEFSFKNRGLSLSQYTSGHVGVALHTQRGGHVEVVASHHPASAEGAENPCHEFYTVDFTHRQETRKKSGDFSHTTRTNDSITVFVNRAEIEALHFALGEVLAQSEGLERGAASVRVTGGPLAEGPEGEVVVRVTGGPLAEGPEGEVVEA